MKPNFNLKKDDSNQMAESLTISSFMQSVMSQRVLGNFVEKPLGVRKGIFFLLFLV